MDIHHGHYKNWRLIHMIKQGVIYLFEMKALNSKSFLLKVIYLPWQEINKLTGNCFLLQDIISYGLNWTIILWQEIIILDKESFPLTNTISDDRKLLLGQDIISSDTESFHFVYRTRFLANILVEAHGKLVPRFARNPTLL